MPRYFFHLYNGEDVADYEGHELADLESARQMAEAYAVDMAAVSVAEQRKLILYHRIELADEAGEILQTVQFADVITVQS
jgi:hypothetical protein